MRRSAEAEGAASRLQRGVVGEGQTDGDVQFAALLWS